MELFLITCSDSSSVIDNPTCLVAQLLDATHCMRVSTLASVIHRCQIAVGSIPRRAFSNPSPTTVVLVTSLVHVPSTCAVSSQFELQQPPKEISSWAFSSLRTTPSQQWVATTGRPANQSLKLFLSAPPLSPVPRSVLRSALPVKQRSCWIVATAERGDTA